MTETIIVCAGGPVSELMNFDEFKGMNSVKFIGADRGALHLLDAGILPDEAVGDFDSVSKEEYDRIVLNVPKVDQFAAEKDETDVEIAVMRALLYQPETIVLTGVTGGRIDHFQSALHLLYRLQKNHPMKTIFIRNRTNELSLLTAGIHEIQNNQQFQYISFFPFKGTVEGLSLKGFKYNTQEATLETGMTMFTSNELLEEVCTISFRKGICLMVRSSDS